MRIQRFIFANKENDGEWFMSFPLTFSDIISGGHVDWFDENTIVREWTGLHDKNGKEIYEGDIVRFEQESHEETTSHGIGEIVYKEDSYVIRHITSAIPNKVTFNDWDEIEIIGNIYENTELLTK